MTSLARTVIVVAVGAAAIAATVSLGFWQVRRGAEKEALEARVEAAARETPTAPRDWNDASGLVGHHVAISGRWLPDRVVYLDNRPMHGRAGLYVLMALRTDGALPRTIVVNRGWIPRDMNERTRIAPFKTLDGPVTLAGIAIADEPHLLEIGTASPQALAGLWQNFAFDDFQRLAGGAVVPLVVRQDHDGVDDGLVRDWPDRGGALQTQIDRHHGYAFQWFALATTIAALLLFQFYRVLRTPRSHG